MQTHTAQLVRGVFYGIVITLTVVLATITHLTSNQLEMIVQQVEQITQELDRMEQDQSTRVGIPVTQNTFTVSQVILAIKGGDFNHDELSTINEESYVQLTALPEERVDLLTAQAAKLQEEVNQLREEVADLGNRLSQQATASALLMEQETEEVPVCIPTDSNESISSEYDTLCREMAARAAFNDMVGDILHENPLLFTGTELQPGNIHLTYNKEANIYLLSIGKYVDDGRGPLHFHKDGLQNVNIDYGLYGDRFTKISPLGAYVKMFAFENVDVSVQFVETGNDALFQVGTWHIPIKTFDGGSEEAQRYIKIIQDFIALDTSQYMV